MGKKKFSDGLNDLFSEAYSGVETIPMGDTVSEAAKRSGERKLSGGKTFMNDLDALLHEALEESLEKYESRETGGNRRRPTLSHKSRAALREDRAAFGGLDALIRQTIDVKEIETDEATGVRRLTVAVDRSKLEKLKTIARMENAYLKDLLVGLIDEYIHAYTQEKGIDL